MPDETQHSSDLTVSEAANQIAALSSSEAVLAFIGDDERQGVVKAADARLADLASTPSSEIRLGAAGSDPRAKQGSPLETGGTGTKIVRTRFPVDRFEHGIDGVPVITAQGVEVPAGRVEKLLELAASHDTQLEEVEA